MPITPRAEDHAFLREVDEELRRDQMEGLVRRHGRTAIVAAILLLAIVGGVLAWGAHRTGVRERRAEQFTQAITDLSAGDKAKATPALAALAGSSDAGYRALALLTQADAAVEDGHQDAKAIALYRQIADDTAFAQPVRDLARVRQAATAFDSVPPSQIVAMLSPLAQPGNPWFGSAGEMVAMAYQAEGKAAEAARLFTTISKDAKVPDSIRSRARQMAASLGDGAGKASATGKTAPVIVGGDDK
ncbi:MAG: tetratricopeptide repeat protein [Sphingomonadaceae bacterium]|nr:tetratricopeptide repeat protein [Sphingomonadaceae bacterium]